LNKFLQVLDDGVLTSGRGDRVYFSEALIIFTSNLGIYSGGAAGDRVQNVSPSEPFETLNAKVRAGIEEHFKSVLNRPELLNRVGENIIVFDFIRHDVAQQIFDQMIDALLADLKAAGFDITISEGVRAELRTLCLADLSNGGRGIRNQVEAHLVNPLSRALFDGEAQPGRLMRSFLSGMAVRRNSRYPEWAARHEDGDRNFPYSFSCDEARPRSACWNLAITTPVAREA
jgi:ATP-dependent Clp protease ATP-binding subunit ClpA